VKQDERYKIISLSSMIDVMTQIDI
jgi:hypothetical protein